MQRYKVRVCLFLIVWIVLGVVGLTSRVSAELPTRPTKTPIPSKDRSLPAGTIILDTLPTQSSLWSVVQWQAVDGSWKDVEGWKGVVNDGKTIWWVEEGDWGKSPYRWVVSQSQGKPLLAISEPFTLPDSGQKIIITVNLPE